MLRTKANNLLSMRHEYGPPSSSQAWQHFARLEPDRMAQVRKLAISAQTTEMRSRIKRLHFVQRLVPNVFDLTLNFTTNSIVELNIRRAGWRRSARGPTKTSVRHAQTKFRRSATRPRHIGEPTMDECFIADGATR